MIREARPILPNEYKQEREEQGGQSAATHPQPEDQSPGPRHTALSGTARSGYVTVRTDVRDEVHPGWGIQPG